MSWSSVHTILCTTIHAADLSNVAKAWATTNEWGNRAREEFHHQGDIERQRGDVPPLTAAEQKMPGFLLPKSKQWDLNKAPYLFVRGHSPLANTQLGFINFLVLPLYNTLNAIPGVNIQVS